MRMWKRAACAVGLSLLMSQVAQAQAAYPAMAPIEQYRSAEEVALARSAAPPSLSGDADVLVLGAKGYEIAAKGKNGFVCIVQRGWATDFGDAEFWNPKIRAPICFNPASARSVLPSYLERTKWVLAGDSPAQMIQRTKAARAAGIIKAPEAGAMCFMMSKAGYLSDKTHHWQPHLMFFTPVAPPSAWGANLPGVPVLGGGGGDLEPVSVFFAPVRLWSDGTPAPAM